ncbi:MAG: PH domain-containing protein [bacterium]
MSDIEKKVYTYIGENPGSVAWRIHKHCKIIQKHLNEDEEVLFAFVGQKNDEFYNIFTTAVLVLTDQRLMIAQKRVLFGYFFKSITTEMFNDLSVYSGLFWGKVKIDTVKETVVLSNVSKKGLDDIESNITLHMMRNEDNNRTKEKKKNNK